MFDLISISEAIKRSYDSEGLLVDVRSEEVFKKGHLPMAVNLPFEEIMNEKFDIEAIEKDFNIEKEQLCHSLFITSMMRWIAVRLVCK